MLHAVLHAVPCVIHPVPDFRGRQIMRSAGLGQRRLAANNLDAVRGFSRRCPSVETALQWSAHRSVFLLVA